MKLSDEVRTWLSTGSDCEFDYYGYGDRIAALEAERDELAAELAAAKSEIVRLRGEIVSAASGR